MRVLRRFLRDDLFEVVGLIAGLMLANLAATRFADRPDSGAIDFLLGVVGALAGLLAGKWLHSRYGAWRRRNDDRPD